MEITDQEIKQARRRFWILILSWNLVSITGFFGFVVIGNFILKNYLGHKGTLATCNDTEDGDYAPAWFMPGERRSFITTAAWWFRNHSNNYLNAQTPEWNGGEVDAFKKIKCTIPKIDMVQKGVFNPFTKANRKKGIFGVNHYAYRLNGKVFVSYSRATKKREIQIGAGGNEWRLWRKPIF